MVDVVLVILSLKNELVYSFSRDNFGHNLVKFLHDSLKVLTVQKSCNLLILRATIIQNRNQVQ